MGPTAVHDIIDRYQLIFDRLGRSTESSEAYLVHVGRLPVTRVPGLVVLDSENSDDDLKVSYFTTSSLLRIALTIAGNIRASVTAQRNDKNPKTKANERPVGVLLSEGPLLAACELGVLFSGHPLLPLDLNDPRAGKMAELAGAVLLIAPDTATCLPKTFASLQSVIKPLSSLLEPSNRLHLPLLPEADWTSHIFLTSGSTGLPKVCMLNHSALAVYSRRKPILHDITSESTVLILSPPTFDPHWGDLVSSLAVGARIVTVDRDVLLDGTKIARVIEKTQATHVCTTPAVWKHVPIPAIGATSLKVLALGGERTPRKMAEGWSAVGVRVINTFGVTECCVYQAVADFRPEVDGGERLLGSAVEEGGVLLRILDKAELEGDELERNVETHELIDAAKARSELAPGTVAEIVLARTMVGRYLSQDSTNPTGGFTTHPQHGSIFLTGDLVKLLPGSNWALVGRHVSDTRIKISGRRADLLEVEGCLVDEFGSLVKELCVVPFSAGDSIALACVCIPSESVARGQDIWESLLLELARRSVPSFLVPARFFFVDTLPVARTGKLDRKALRTLVLELLLQQPAVDESEQDHDYGGWIAPVKSTWKTVLNLPKEPVVNSSFAEWGGDSFACARACTLLWEAFRTSAGNNGTEDGQDEEGDGGKWGERLPGAFAPGELLKRPKLKDWAEHFRDRMGRFASTLEGAEGDQDPKTTTTFSETDVLSEILRKACTSVEIPPIVSFLLSEGVAADLNVPAGSPTPLHGALFLGHFAAARLLLEAGADPLRRGAEGMQAIHFAVQGSLHAGLPEFTSILELLLAKGSKLDGKDSTGGSVFHHAARVGVSKGTFDLLLSIQQQGGSARKDAKRGKDSAPHPLSWRDMHGRTPLHWATLNGHRTLVQFMVTNYPNECLLDAKDNDGETAVVMAMRRARCGAEERGGRGGATVWGDIAGLLGGGGSTKEVRIYAKDK